MNRRQVLADRDTIAATGINEFANNCREPTAMTSPSPHERHMRRCIELARQAIGSGDTPVGSLIVEGNELVSEGIEAVRARHDATAHAEMEALRTAFVRRRSRDLTGCTLYTSVEPCIMRVYGSDWPASLS